MSNYIVNINGYANSLLTITNKKTDFQISGTTNAPNGARVELRLGIHRRYATVSNGTFQISYDRNVQVRRYVFYIYITDPYNSKSVTKKTFNLNIVDTQGPQRIPANSFQSTKSSNGTMLLTWARPQEMFEVKNYLIYKNGAYVATVNKNRYITAPMGMDDIDAYRIVSIDDSNNMSPYSFGFAVQRNQRANQANLSSFSSFRPSLNIIDTFDKIYSTTQLTGGVIAANPISFPFQDLFENSDICNLIRSSRESNQLKFIVSSIPQNIGTVEIVNISNPSSKRAIQVGDIIDNNFRILWTPSQKFINTTTVLTLKAITNSNVQSNTSANLRVKLV